MTEELAKALGTNLTLAQKLRLKKQQGCLLLDISSSMASEIEPGHSKLQALKDIVEGLSIASAYIFSSSIRKVAKSAIPSVHSGGGTNMAGALNTLKLEGHKKIVMITDGQPDNQATVLEAVQGIELRILYVGPEPKPKFLDELAKAGASFCSQEDLKLTKELTDKVQLLLGSPQEAIQL